MKNQASNQGIFWMLAGGACVALLVSVVWLLREDPAQAVAARASRAQLISGMELALASASEAEKSAVLATTDEASEKFAAQARSATAEVERGSLALRKLVADKPRESDLLAQFSAAFASLKGIDEELLRLAVQNANIKAYALLFGPAADALAAMDAGLARVVTRLADLPDAKQLVALAFGARIAVLRIQVLLAPHIAEASDAKMDQLEAQMAIEEALVRKDLEDLAALAPLRGDADLATAASSFARYVQLKARILALSRENTNVRSLAMSLNQKRKALVLCLDALHALQQAIREEQIPGLPNWRPPSPR